MTITNEHKLHYCIEEEREIFLYIFYCPLRFFFYDCFQLLDFSSIIFCPGQFSSPKFIIDQNVYIFFCNYNKKSYTSRLVQLSFTFRHHMYIKVCQLVSFFPVFSHFELFSPSDFILIFLHFCCDGFINYRNSDIVLTL